MGDPLEVARVAAWAKAGFGRQRLAQRFREIREDAFDPEVKKMATVHERERGYLVAVKGAAESVIAACSHVRAENGEHKLTDDERRRWLTRSDRLATDGLRVLALAERRVESADAPPYEELTLLGLIGFLDPPRRDVAAAIADRRGRGWSW